MTDVDYVKRDGKVVSGESGYFLPKMVGFTALSWSLGLPVALVGGMLNVAQKAVSGSTKAPSKSIGPKFVYPPVSACMVSDLKPPKDRDFDVVMFGATGFTGELAARYLSKQYQSGEVKFAVAGRRREALERVKAECEKISPGLNLTILDGVDSSDEKSLQDMCARTRVVLTTVGPFQNYGTPLVRACISTGTSYCDITGETDWYSGLIEAYDSAAREAGSKIVSFCGHDCVPWDLMAYSLAKQLGTEKMQSVRMEDEVTGRPSGGTVATILETIKGGAAKPESQLSFSPLLLNEKGEKSEFHTKDTSSILPSKKGEVWSGPFVMAMVNAQVVRRSNALNGYGPNLSYFEARSAPSFGVLAGRYLQLVAMGPLLVLPESLQKHILPQPGQGPSEAEMDKGFLQITGMAVGEQGTTVRARIYFNTDPGYRDTARMLAETGLSIALNPERCDRVGGVLTPASCCPETLLERLKATGTEFGVLSSL